MEEYAVYTYNRSSCGSAKDDDNNENERTRLGAKERRSRASARYRRKQGKYNIVKLKFRKLHASPDYRADYAYNAFL